MTSYDILRLYVCVPAGFCHGMLVSSFVGIVTLLGKAKYCGKETSTLYSTPLLG